MKLVNLHLIDRQRPTLIYLPGLDGTGKLFYRQYPDLAHHFNLLALRFSPTPLPPTWKTIAKILHQLIHKSNVAPPLYLCGESFGGCLALVYSCQYPQDVAKLILINPATAFHRRPWLQWGIPFHHWLPTPFQNLTTLTGLPFLAAMDRLELDDRQQLLKAMRSIPPAIVAERLTLLQNFSKEQINPSQIQAPSLILASQRDLLLPSVEEAQRIKAQIADAKIHLLPNSGHACLLEKELSLGQILKTAQWLPEPILPNRNLRIPNRRNILLHPGNSELR
jgi:pimeloyl-ACP methyl ester carboxylesterase